MVNRPREYNSYEFVVVASLRAKQLLAGCVPQVEGDHNAAITAQMEVADGRVARATNQVTTFGGFFDSVIDRYSDVALFFGLLVYYAATPRSTLHTPTSICESLLLAKPQIF